LMVGDVYGVYLPLGETLTRGDEDGDLPG